MVIISLFFSPLFQRGGREKGGDTRKIVEKPFENG